MKTERRHELQTNELADSLGHWLEAIRPYTRALVGIVIAAVLLVAGLAYLSNQRQQKLAEGWTDFFKIVNEIAASRDATQMNDGVVKLEVFRDEYKNTPLDYWSRIVAADFRLSTGTSELFKDKAEARGQLNDALKDYRYVTETARDPAVLQRAYFGRARAEESLGELKDAAEDYKTVIQRWPTSPYSAMANKRVEDLEQQQTKEFYDWFAKYQPPKAPAAGERPIFDHDSLLNSGLPSSSNDIKLPSNLDLLDGPAPTTTTPSTTTPATAPPATTDEPKKEEPKTEAPATTPEVKTETPAPTTTPEEKKEAPAPEAKTEAPKAEGEKKEDAPKDPELKLPEAK